MELEHFETKTGFVFNNKALLRQAFTHRSYLNEHKGMGEHNERLEFLGDAVLELVVSEFLYEKYPDRPEGELTSYRAALVNTNSISEAAQELDMNTHLLLSKGESKDTGRARQFILANTFEAFIGALYMDQGYNAAKKFIAQALFGKTDAVVEGRLWQDAKSRFQELVQERHGVTPHYELVDEEGPDHDKYFTAGVFISSEKVAEGTGKSKQEAEQSAAERALKVKGW
ncbi:MAG: ribonuclease III [Patescibacteria group bacterium]